MPASQKKIYYISNVRLPTEKAHGLQIMKMCEAFATQGIETELIVSKRKSHLLDDPFRFYNISTVFSITRVASVDFLWLPFLKKIWFFIQSFTFYFSVKKYITKQADAVYYTRDLFIAAWLSKKVGPVFYEIHSLPKKVYSIHRSAWSRSYGLIAISQGIKQELITHGIPEDKIIVAHDAVDLKQFQITETREDCRHTLGLPLDQKIVLYTGHLYQWKGAHILAEATPFLPNSVHVYLVGGTLEDVQSFRARYQYPNLHIVGWQSHEVIPRWLKAADLLVLPTSAKEKIGAIYTSPLKLFEYIASGTPVIAARTQSIQEILTSNHSVFFQPDNSHDLAEQIKISLEQRLESLSHAAHILADNLESYTWDKRAEKILAFITTFKA